MRRCLPLYLALIAIFYTSSDGFRNRQDNFWTYAILKTLPCISLSAVTALGMTGLKGAVQHLVALALLMGAAGDFLLAMGDDGFLPGACAFLLGHLCYTKAIFALVQKLHSFLTVTITIYIGIINFFFLLPMLTASYGTLVLSAYSVALSVPLVLSGSIFFHGTSPDSIAAKKTSSTSDLSLSLDSGISPELMSFIGFLLFYISDTLILACKVGYPTDPTWVMSTYYAAQYLILSGFSKILA